MCLRMKKPVRVTMVSVLCCSLLNDFGISVAGIELVSPLLVKSKGQVPKEEKWELQTL